MTADDVSSPSKSSPKNLVTLEILLNLLQARGLNDTASCLQREAGFGPLPGSRDNSPGNSPMRKGEPSELVGPATEEALRVRSHAASLAQAEQRRRIASLAQEMSKQGQQMSEIRDLVHRVRSAASSVQRPSLEEQEEQIKRNDAEIRELEIICFEREALGRNLRVELDRTTSEVAELRKSLEEREDEETRARIQLTKLEDEAAKLNAELDAIPVSTQARKIQALLAAWHDQDGHLQVMVRSIFTDIDRDRDGRLEWNNNEIRNFVRELFTRNGIMVPNWQDKSWYEMYRKADVNKSYSLELAEAVHFAHGCFEAALALVLTGQSENGNDLTVSGDHWARTQQVVPVARQAMTYSSGVVIDFREHGTVLQPVITANLAHRVRMTRIIESGDHLKATMRTYRECDKDGNGRLTWNNGEIRDFIAACFRQHGLSPPNEEQIFNLYSKFDKDKNNALDMRECLEMIDALFRSTFIVESSGNQVQPTAMRSLRASSPVQTMMQPRVVQAGALIPTTIRGVSPGRTLPTNMLQPTLFDQMDANHDGVITRSELNSAVQRGLVQETVATGTLRQTLALTSSSHGRSPSPQGMNIATGQYGFTGVVSGAPQNQFLSAAPQSVASSAGGLVRMRSGDHSPGMPVPSTAIIQTTSPRANSPVGTVVFPNPAAYARTASPMAGSLTIGGGYLASGISPAPSTTGSFVSSALPYNMQQLRTQQLSAQQTQQLGRSGSNDKLQAQSVPAPGGAVMKPGTVQNAGGPYLGTTRAAPRSLQTLAPVLRSRDPTRR